MPLVAIQPQPSADQLIKARPLVAIRLGEDVSSAYVSPQVKAAQAQAQLAQRLRDAQALQPVKSGMDFGTIALIGVGVIVLGVAAMAAFKFSK